jgi:uncharacterized protein YceH (UPF0502 family)
MAAFSSMEEAEEVVRSLMESEDGPFVLELPRQPGRKEPRFVNLFSGREWAEQFNKAADTPVETVAFTAGPSQSDRIAELEERVASLEGRLQELRKEFEDFRKVLE